MFKYFLLPLTLGIGAVVFFSVRNASESEINYTEEQPGAADEWLFEQKTFPYGKIDKTAQRNAVQLALHQKALNKLMKTEADVDDWHFIGPVTIGGRIADIECPVGDDNTIYVGTASGGVLNSYDKGNSWENIFDDNGSLSIGDLAIDPNDTSIIYCGTGETDCGVGSVTYDGDGIYKSTNGGATWTNIGLVNSGNTGRIAINPANTQIVFAAMLGDLFQNNSERGIYRTEDGGATWQQVLYINDSTGGIDVTINPDDPDIVYASTWERVRRFNRKDYAGFGSRIYRSTDGGDTWTMLTSGLPGGELCKITLALSPTNPQIIYAGILGANEKLKDIYKSVNGGDTWTALNCAAEVIVGTTDFWYAGVKVNPNDPNKVYWIGFESSRSSDGGNTWSQFANSTHVDHQAFYMSPTDENFKILGGDGGLFFTSNDFATYTTDQNIPVTQLYTLDVYPGDTARLIGGAQDNGCFTRDAFNNWIFANGGDGVSARFVPVDENSYYANYQYGGYYGLVLGTGQPLFGYDPSDRHNWRSPLELNPLNPKTIYFGGSKIQRTNNYGNSLTTISDDLTNGDQGIGGLTFGTIFTLHNAPADTNYIYAGTDDANVWRSKDYGASWTKITDGLPYRYCMSIETDPNDAEIVYVAFSGFRWADDAAHIYKSIDAGDTWTDISGDLPDIPVNDIQVNKVGDSTLLSIATDVGCYYSYNDGLNWNMLGTAMPVLSVYEIYYDVPTETLFAGTYGRGAWKMKVPRKEPEVNVAITDLDQIEIQIAPNPVSDQLQITATNFIDHAELEIFDAAGNIVITQKINSAKQLIIPVKQLNAGNYFVCIRSGNSKLIKKVIVI